MVTFARIAMRATKIDLRQQHLAALIATLDLSCHPTHIATA